MCHTHRKDYSCLVLRQLNYMLPVSAVFKRLYVSALYCWHGYTALFRGLLFKRNLCTGAVNAALALRLLETTQPAVSLSI